VELVKVNVALLAIQGVDGLNGKGNESKRKGAAPASTMFLGFSF
jgi:hypothetical protein